MQTDRHADRQTCRQTDMQTDREADAQTFTVHLKGLSVEWTCLTWLLRWSGLEGTERHKGSDALRATFQVGSGGLKLAAEGVE